MSFNLSINFETFEDLQLFMIEFNIKTHKEIVDFLL